ncbi:GTP cyclohydrolase 1 feedback regulatory protein isoform X1 [Mycteria americana]|uniref:GTP cyclohydrolase 1 feedback regulatory protein isoform X1 n=1 Tax=Mycteria americana TaxID=33587 RepID=UPI003F5836B8
MPYLLISTQIRMLGVLRERRTADSLEQAGELRLPGGEHDRRGPDLGVVPPQGIARKTSAFHPDEILPGIISRRTDSKLFPLIPFCPRLQALGHGGRSGVEAKLDPMEASHPCHFARPGGGRHAQSRRNRAQRTDGSISAFS